MKPFVESARIALILAWLAAPSCANATIISPVKSFTIELLEPNVENSYRLVEGILVAHGFWRVNGTPRFEANESTPFPPPALPKSAPPEKGLIIAIFEDTAGTKVALMATACRIRVDILRQGGTDDSLREQVIPRIAKFLIEELYDRTNGHSEFIDGFTYRNDPCTSD